MSRKARASLGGSVVPIPACNSFLKFHVTVTGLEPSHVAVSEERRYLKSYVTRVQLGIIVKFTDAAAWIFHFNAKGEI